MATNVTIKAKAWTDSRFDLLAELIGQTRDVALIRMAMLWGQCTDDETHILGEATIRGRLGRQGVDAILEADLGERVDGGIRIKGTGADTTDWLAVKRRAGRSGGKQRAANAEARRKQTASSAQTEPKHAAADPEAQSNPRDLDQDPLSSAAGAPPLREAVDNLWHAYTAACDARGLKAKPFVPGDEQGIRALLSQGWTVEQIEQHLAAVVARAARYPNERLWADGKRTWKQDVLREAYALELAGAEERGGRPGPRALRDPAADTMARARALAAEGR